MSISYTSTRGSVAAADLRHVTMTGLAPDGGLYVPHTWPQFTLTDILALTNASYQDIAFMVMRPFFAGSLDDATLRTLIAQAYSTFHDPAITPLRKLDDRLSVLELFHGPTLAFKDVALQFLGTVFDYFLTQSKNRMTVVGATSGDTGSAAIAALAGRKNIDVFILYPHKGPSDIQRRQMTCVDAPNIHAIAIDGSFDDCQSLVKALFADEAFRQQHNLAAVNSINWLRILAQMVYYVATAARLGANKPISYVVPTGNFGNIYAAYAATQCGLLTSKLAIASNVNDVLPRFFGSGTMQAYPVQNTTSPSMDIQISSNFERLLFDLVGRAPKTLSALMHQLQQDKSYTVSPLQLGMARQLFTAGRVNDDETITTIRSTYDQYGYILDPHSAVGMATAQKLRHELPDPVVTLACAHPAKFPDIIERAIGLRPELPAYVAKIIDKPERSTLIQANITTLKALMVDRTTA